MTKAVILAAGKGVRMKSEQPKVLQDILGAPILSHVLTAVREAGISDIIVVVGFQADRVREEIGSDVSYVEQRERLGTGHALLCCKKALAGHDGEVLVLTGDAPLIRAETIRDLLELHRKKGAQATLLSAKLDDPTGYGRVLRNESGEMTRVVEHLDASDEERQVREVNSAEYVFDNKALLEALEKVEPRNAQKEYYLPDVLPHLNQVHAWCVSDATEILGINSRKDLAGATAVMRQRFLDQHMDAGVTIVDPSSTFIEVNVEIGIDTVIQPFTVIRAGVQIGPNCEVGPFSQVRAGTILEEHAEVGNFVEVKNSHIGRGSKAKHLAYVGDARLGEKVNIGAGTITANYDGKNKHRSNIGDGVHTGSNSVLVAPVTLGKGAKTGAGAVVVGGTVAENTVVVGVPARALKRGSEKVESASEGGK
ncbi:MAG: NTP transferase domain-containing protein [Planctomycetota bacterium]|jgi:bifunctional UDP-N-acetylglucosamine pyrophosphorylase/glucosamine-1-phosphate N-acetyltransferase|nr:NTP transferase domain-containing protein [Planctomycetota bacterium]